MQAKQDQTGVTFSVRVTPRASREQIVGVAEGALKVQLTAPPVDGAANAALVKLLAKALGLAKSRVSIVSGERSRDKVVAVAGISLADLQARLGLG
ncbi:MAG: YggU family protein [Desulfovibrio sp.]|nr:YggU family protein [Desulfovibrio sp.]